MKTLFIAATSLLALNAFAETKIICSSAYEKIGFLYTSGSTENLDIYTGDANTKSEDLFKTVDRGHTWATYLPATGLFSLQGEEGCTQVEYKMAKDAEGKITLQEYDFTDAGQVGAMNAAYTCVDVSSAN
jgi:hypothetical protein